MKIEDYHFSQEEIARFKTYRDQQPDFRLQKRFLSLLLIAEGVFWFNVNRNFEKVK